MQTPSNIDRLAGLEAELVKAQKEAETVAGSVGKENPAGVSQLKAAAKELGEKRRHVVAAREALLEFDGYLRARQELGRQESDDPEKQGRADRFVGAIGQRMAARIEEVVGRLSDEVMGDVSHVSSVVQTIRSVQDSAARTKAAEECAAQVEKILAAARKAVDKAVEGRLPEPEIEEGLVDDVDDVEEAEEIEVAPADDHGYDLTASKMSDFIKEKIEEREKEKGDEEGKEKGEKPKKGEVPPQFLEHMKKKKADGHGYDLTAESRVPGNESKGPKELEEEDEGWVPGHRTQKKAYALTDDEPHGYRLDA